jgi:hypothetical protein
MKNITFTPLHSSDIYKVEEMWLLLGGRIESVRRTGETRYRHEAIDRPLRVNGRRGDVPAKLLTLLNRVARLRAANDRLYGVQSIK